MAEKAPKITTAQDLLDDAIDLGLGAKLLPMGTLELTFGDIVTTLPLNDITTAIQLLPDQDLTKKASSFVVSGHLKIPTRPLKDVLHSAAFRLVAVDKRGHPVTEHDLSPDQFKKVPTIAKALWTKQKNLLKDLKTVQRNICTCFNNRSNPTFKGQPAQDAMNAVSPDATDDLLVHIRPVNTTGWLKRKSQKPAQFEIVGPA